MIKNPFFPLAVALLAAVALPAAAQSCNPNIQASTPTTRFQVNPDGTVLDLGTGLMWRQCPEGRSGPACTEGAPEAMGWAEALRRAAESAFAGHTDWRLPNSKELESLLEVRCYHPVINLEVFPRTPSKAFWSSSGVTGSSNNAWTTSFARGDSYVRFQKKYAALVRLVR